MSEAPRPALELARKVLRIEAQAILGLVDRIGSDFERTVQLTPRLLDRKFGPEEQELPLRSLAESYAAREALIKAIGGSDGLRFQDVEITTEQAGRPFLSL